jgi:hypothetical protein
MKGATHYENEDFCIADINSATGDSVGYDGVRKLRKRRLGICVRHTWYLWLVLVLISCATVQFEYEVAVYEDSTTEKIVVEPNYFFEWYWEPSTFWLYNWFPFLCYDW